jgi:Raf kinase inhibitor-like YbhB/YbcL family protein
MLNKICLILIAFLFLTAFSGEKNSKQKKEKTMKITVTSNAFQEGGMIPKKFTCDGENISPQLAWNNIPQVTKSLAIINDDPDAPGGVWVHWVIYNIPPESKELQEHILPQKVLQNGTKQGTNDFRKIGYGGPCPPGGTHRYFFKIFALDKMLTEEAGLTKAQLLKAMEGHILADGQLMGIYKR